MNPKMWKVYWWNVLENILILGGIIVLIQLFLF